MLTCHPAQLFATPPASPAQTAVTPPLPYSTARSHAVVVEPAGELTQVDPPRLGTKNWVNCRPWKGQQGPGSTHVNWQPNSKRKLLQLFFAILKAWSRIIGTNYWKKRTVNRFRAGICIFCFFLGGVGEDSKRNLLGDFVGCWLLKQKKWVCICICIPSPAWKIMNSWWMLDELNAVKLSVAERKASLIVSKESR